jgi:hypothetical protein
LEPEGADDEVHLTVLVDVGGGDAFGEEFPVEDLLGEGDRRSCGGGGRTVNGTFGAGGLGGGGNANGGLSGTANTGGGGAGGSGGSPGYASGSGGSGIVIISHLNTYPTATVTGSPTVQDISGNTVYTFTGTGSITFQTITA